MKKLFGEKGQWKSRTRDKRERGSSGNICKMKYSSFGVGAAKGSSFASLHLEKFSKALFELHSGGTEGAVRTCSLTASPQQNPPVALHHC